MTEGLTVQEAQRIIGGEARRLNRRMPWVEVEDASQDGWVIALESGVSTGPGALLRTVVRRRLINLHIVKALAAKRAAERVSVDGLEGYADKGMDRLSTHSHESEVVLRVSVEGAARWLPPPRDDGGTRQARHQRRARWLARVEREYGP